MTTRRWLVAVAAAGVVCGVAVIAWRLWDRHVSCRLLAESYAAEERAQRIQVEACRLEAEVLPLMAQLEDYNLGANAYRSPDARARRAARIMREAAKASEDAFECAARAADAANLRLKYERAARYPWLPVPPDPSSP
jgi:hypothetical protein